MEPKIVSVTSGEVLEFSEWAAVIKVASDATNGTLTVIETRHDPGEGASPHIHSRESETFVVMDGAHAGLTLDEEGGCCRGDSVEEGIGGGEFAIPPNYALRKALRRHPFSSVTSRAASPAPAGLAQPNPSRATATARPSTHDSGRLALFPSHGFQDGSEQSRADHCSRVIRPRLKR